MKGIRSEMEDTKWFLFAADMFVHVENPKESTKLYIKPNKWVQQGCRLKDQYIKINSISIY